MNLIIVESPTKARTFNRLLKGKDFFVFATFGHIRDLPANKLAISYENKFQPEFEIIKNKAIVVKNLIEYGKKNQSIIFATDLDREGESIAYHAAYFLGFIKEKWPNFNIISKKPFKRIIFHEITKTALEEALKHPISLRIDLIKAQQTRRILDRIVGYELSPLLWKKTGKNWLSAGRVQTVALRLIVEREKEIRRFTQEKYYQIYADFENGENIRAKLIKKDDILFEQNNKIKLFVGEYQFTKTTISIDKLEKIKDDLINNQFIILDFKESLIKRYPPPPLTTSLLQQEGFNHFRFSSKMTMKLAQDLYEHGLITYHRTDSFNLAFHFLSNAKKFIETKYGSQYSLAKPRFYKTKSRLAQEAHEAIRPTKASLAVLTKSDLTINHKRLYQLIFNRAISTQMKEAEIRQIKIFINSTDNYLFQADQQQVIFDGFLKLLNPEFVNNNSKKTDVKPGLKTKLINLEAKESLTQPPPRYNEATLIKIMEEKGIGRPSTYASIISLIQEKGYVEKDYRYFIPTFLGEAISDYLSSAFPKLFEIDFTASMEDDLDKIANGERNITQILSDFYQPFKHELIKKKQDKQKINIEEKIDEKCPKCNSKLTFRYSKFGKFYACSGYPQCKFTKSFLKAIPNKKCPKCQGNIVIKYTKKHKRFFGCANYPKCDYSSWRLN